MRRMMPQQFLPNVLQRAIRTRTNDYSSDPISWPFIYGAWFMCCVSLGFHANIKNNAYKFEESFSCISTLSAAMLFFIKYNNENPRGLRSEPLAKMAAR